MGKIVGGNITQGLAFQEQETYDTQTYYIKSSLGGNYSWHLFTCVLVMQIPGSSLNGKFQKWGQTAVCPLLPRV